MGALDKQEEWRPIPGFPGYEASSLGRIGSWKPERNFAKPPKDIRVLRPGKDKDGYRKTMLTTAQGKRTVRACRLVALAWHGEPLPGMVVRHLDGSRDNDVPGNLAWGTPKENSADMEWHQTRIRGESVNTAKLTAQDVLYVLRSKEGPTALSIELGVTPANISHIRCGRSWAHVSA